MSTILTRPSAGTPRDSNPMDIMGKVVKYSEDLGTVFLEVVNGNPDSKMLGKTVAMSIKPVELKPTDGKSRQPQIADFAKGKHPMPATPVGGMIMMTGASFKQTRDKVEGADYQMEARWPVYVSAKAEQIRAYSLITGSKFTKDGVTTSSYSVTALDMDNAVEVGAADMIGTVLAHVKQARAANENPAVLINVINADGDISGAMFKRTFLVRKEDGGAVSYSAPDTAEEIMAMLKADIEKSPFKDAFNTASGFSIATGTTYTGTNIDPTKQKHLGLLVGRLIGRDENAGFYAAPAMLSLMAQDNGNKLVTQAFPLAGRSDPVKRLADKFERVMIEALGGTPTESAADSQEAEAVHATAVAQSAGEKPDVAASLFADAPEADEPPAPAVPPVSRKRVGM